MNHAAEWDAAHEKREMMAKVPDNRLIAFANPIIEAHAKSENPYPLQFLDVGCGTGLSAEWLVGHGCAVCAFDSSANAILRAYNRLTSLKRHLPRFVIADLTKPWPYRKDSFDAVVDIRSLENLSEKEIAFAWDQAFRVLKRGGKFLSVCAGPDRNDKLTAAGTVTKCKEQFLHEIIEDTGFQAQAHLCTVIENGKQVEDWHITAVKP